MNGCGQVSAQCSPTPGIIEFHYAQARQQSVRANKTGPWPRNSLCIDALAQSRWVTGSPAQAMVNTGLRRNGQHATRPLSRA